MAQLSIIELVVRKTAVQLNIPESIVEKIVSYKHKTVLEALRLYNSVEDSGLGTYTVRSKVAVRRLIKVNKDINWIKNQLQEGKETLTEKKIGSFMRSLEGLEEEKLYLESKL